MYRHTKHTHSRLLWKKKNETKKNTKQWRGNASYHFLRNIMYTMLGYNFKKYFYSPSLMDGAWPNYISFYSASFFSFCLLLLVSRLERKPTGTHVCNSSPVAMYRGVIWFGGKCMNMCVCLCVLTMCDGRERMSGIWKKDTPILLCPSIENTHFRNQLLPYFCFVLFCF